MKHTKIKNKCIIAAISHNSPTYCSDKMMSQFLKCKTVLVEPSQGVATGL
jgi:hypothetical protein